MLKLNIQQFGGRGASSSAGKKTSWNNLKKAFPNKLVTDGINQIQLYGEGNDNEDIRKVWSMMDRQYGDEYKNAYNTTLKELNEAPIVITTFSGNRQYMNIYKNRKDMFNSINKEYGGIKEFTGSSSDKNNRYSISSLVGGGEFFLERYRYAKGGWRWMDANNNWVEGYEKQWRKRRER